MNPHEHLLHRLQSQHLPINWLSDTLPAERLNISPAAGKWSIHDLIAHLAKYQVEFIERINRILNEYEPTFNRYKAEDDPDFEKWRSWSTHDLIERLKSDRQQIFKLITKLSLPQFERKGIHPKFGSMNILQWTDFFLWHEAHHIFVMFQLGHDVDLGRR